MRAWHVVTLVLVALVLGTSFAHVLQWPAKTGHALRFVLHLVAFVLVASAATQIGSPARPRHSERSQLANT